MAESGRSTDAKTAKEVGLSLGFADADHRSPRIDIWSGNLVKVEYIVRKGNHLQILVFLLYHIRFLKSIT
jgi:hypothetical protein